MVQLSQSRDVALSKIQEEKTAQQAELAQLHTMKVAELSEHIEKMVHSSVHTDNETAETPVDETLSERIVSLEEAVDATNIKFDEINTTVDATNVKFDEVTTDVMAKLKATAELAAQTNKIVKEAKKSQSDKPMLHCFRLPPGSDLHFGIQWSVLLGR
jgi:hypothetical protein